MNVNSGIHVIKETLEIVCLWEAMVIILQACLIVHQIRNIWPYTP